MIFDYLLKFGTLSLGSNNIVFNAPKSPFKQNALLGG